MIIDFKYIEQAGKCRVCKKHTSVFPAYDSNVKLQQLKDIFVCFNCLSKRLPTEDKELLFGFRRYQIYADRKKEAIELLENLKKNYPKIRFYDILYEIIKRQYEINVIAVVALRKLVHGKIPTNGQYSALTSLIRRVREKRRRVYVPRNKVVCSGPGSCGFF